MPKLRYTTETFIEKAKKVHSNKFDYSLVDYINSSIKVKIICHEHGIFEQRPSQHLYGDGCSKCYGNVKKTTEDFVKESSKIHQNKYDYSLADYKHAFSKVKIICPEHGVFEQEAKSHLKGFGCPSCRNTRKYSNEEFVERAIKVHKDIYDYSKTKYTLAHSKITVSCKKHGDFKVYSYQHLQGAGCQKCSYEENISKKEKEINNFIKDLGFETIQTSRKIIPPHEIDIFIPSLSIAIEYNGLYWHSKEVLEKKSKDYKTYHLNKLEKCEEKGIRLIQIFEDEWINNKEEIKEKIKTIIYCKEVFSEKETIDKRWGAGILLKKMGYKLVESSSPKPWYIKNNKRYEKKVSENIICDCGAEVWVHSN